MASEPAEVLPPDVRPGIRKLAAVVALVPGLEEVLKLSESLDLRDLRPAELAYLEQVALPTLARWRVDGTGPAYTNLGGVRYPVRQYIEWRTKRLQRLTAQGAGRGRRADL